MSVVRVAVGVAPFVRRDGCPVRETGLVTCRGGGLYLERYAQPGGSGGAVAHATAAPDAAMPDRKAPASPVLSATRGLARDQPPRTPPAELPRFTVRTASSMIF